MRLRRVISLCSSQSTEQVHSHFILYFHDTIDLMRKLLLDSAQKGGFIDVDDDIKPRVRFAIRKLDVPKVFPLECLLSRRSVKTKYAFTHARISAFDMSGKSSPRSHSITLLKHIRLFNMQEARLT